MKTILAYYIINVKSMSKDLISIICGILFPIILIVFYGSDESFTSDISFFWAYIIFNSYFFGISQTVKPKLPSHPGS